MGKVETKEHLHRHALHQHALHQHMWRSWEQRGGVAGWETGKGRRTAVLLQMGFDEGPHVCQAEKKEMALRVGKKNYIYKSLGTKSVGCIGD